MRISRMLLAMAAVLSAGAAFAAEVPKADDDPNTVEVKRVCRTERSTGSRVVKRVCKTAAEQGKDDREAWIKLKMAPKSQTTEAFKPPVSQ
jgi:hypothetical protein